MDRANGPRNRCSQTGRPGTKISGPGGAKSIQVRHLSLNRWPSDWFYTMLVRSIMVRSNGIPAGVKLANRVGRSRKAHGPRRAAPGRAEPNNSGLCTGLITTDRFPSIFVTDFTPEHRAQRHSTKHNLQNVTADKCSVIIVITIIIIIIIIIIIVIIIIIITGAR